MSTKEYPIVDNAESFEAALARVREAQKIFATYTQEQVDKIFLAAATAANQMRIPLAKMAVEETGMGVAEDKVIKNHFASEYIYNAYRNVKTCGVLEEDKAYGIKKIAEPIGVIAAVIPTTNPTSTAIFIPIPVHCIMDEWPNVALPDDFDKILATMRSRGISCSIIIQNIAQMKALFKDSYESLIGNCDEFLYLGGNEKEGHKYVSELLGKETLDTNTYGQTKGRSGSYSVNYQQTGRELLTPDEIRLLDNRKAILFIRGERPIMDDKYDLKKHVNFRYTEDGGASPYDYAKTPLAHDDLKIDINRLDDYELLSTEDILGE